MPSELDPAYGNYLPPSRFDETPTDGMKRIEQAMAEPPERYNTQRGRLAAGAGRSLEGYNARVGAQGPVGGGVMVAADPVTGRPVMVGGQAQAGPLSYQYSKPTVRGAPASQQIGVGGQPFDADTYFGVSAQQAPGQGRTYGANVSQGGDDGGWSAYAGYNPTNRSANIGGSYQTSFATGGRAVVGHTMAAGEPVSLEEHKGQIRHRQDSGDSRMAADYGYIDTSRPDHDGMKTDAFVGPHRDSKRVFVVNQQHPHTGKFNEHKVLLGYKDRAHALRDYAHSFSDGLGHKRIQSVVEMGTHELKDWLKKPHTQPLKKAEGGPVDEPRPLTIRRGVTPRSLAAEMVPPEEQSPIEGQQAASPSPEGVTSALQGVAEGVSSLYATPQADAAYTTAPSAPVRRSITPQMLAANLSPEAQGAQSPSLEGIGQGMVSMGEDPVGLIGGMLPGIGNVMAAADVSKLKDKIAELRASGDEEGATRLQKILPLAAMGAVMPMGAGAATKAAIKGAEKGAAREIADVAESAAKQAISSADTSIKQIPAIFKSKVFEAEAGARNLDIGGGKYDLGTDYLKNERGVESSVYDPFNRSPEHNAAVLNEFKQNPADTVTAANVLNVIAEPGARAEVIQQAFDHLKPGGKAYFDVYEGSRSGEGAATSKGWQNNMKAQAFLEEVQSVFPDVQRKGTTLIGTKPVDEVAARPIVSADQPKNFPPNSPEYAENLAKFMEGSSVPQRVYHASRQDFPQFDTGMSEFGSHFGTIDHANAMSRSDLYPDFFPSKHSGTQTYPVHVNIKNPIRLNDSGKFDPNEVITQLIDKGILSWDDYNPIMKLPKPEASLALQKILKDRGHDGVVYLNKREGVKDLRSTHFGLPDAEFKKVHPEAQDSYIIFDPNQVKSAIGNQGTFDPARPHINEAKGGAVHAFAQGGAVPLTHYSRRPDLTEVDPAYYGTNNPGEDVARTVGRPDGNPRRSYFYVGQPGDVMPEHNLGEHAYTTSSDKLYDLSEDPLKVYRGPSPRDLNRMEQVIRANGYEGILGQDAAHPTAVLFEKKEVEPHPTTRTEAAYAASDRLAKQATGDFQDFHMRKGGDVRKSAFVLKNMKGSGLDPHSAYNLAGYLAGGHVDAVRSAIMSHPGFARGMSRMFHKRSHGVK